MKPECTIKVLGITKNYIALFAFLPPCVFTKQLEGFATGPCKK